MLRVVPPSVQYFWKYLQKHIRAGSCWWYISPDPSHKNSRCKDAHYKIDNCRGCDTCKFISWWTNKQTKLSTYRQEPRRRMLRPISMPHGRSKTQGRTPCRWWELFLIGRWKIPLLARLLQKKKLCEMLWTFTASRTGLMAWIKISSRSLMFIQQQKRM